MTREERLDLLKQIEKDIHVCSIESTFLDDAKSCAIHSAIEELEQEPYSNILDHIKAEMKERAYLVSSCQYEIGLPLFVILKIIDKYKIKIEENKI